MKVQMLTKENLKALPPYGAQDGKGDAAVAHVKFFSPYSGWTWYATEYDPEAREFYGLVFGFEMEMGPFSLDEMEAVKGPMGVQGIERDRHFKPMTLGEIKRLQQHSGFFHRG